ncbi:S-phase kinase-associated protein 2 [Hippocampus zosterae]|uniref:S-phase kinase-associated protein 2 n=1 Tax=Hippocampus zosterae TaxID=109293 RepID=UPI00223D84CA|nr:S-phase kinase-associated protein 2 [Hippocampus zosterae]
MPGDSVPLQDLLGFHVQGSMLSQATSSSGGGSGNKREWQHVLTEGLDTECTPTELIQQWSPGPKRQHSGWKGKENDGKPFVISRRSRKRKESVLEVSWDHLPDELILRILFFLPLQDLLKASVTCRRWHRLAFDESLWHSVDLEGVSEMAPALRQALKTGVRRLRCPRSFINDLQLTGMCALQIAEMDLSSSIITTPALESIICRCHLLRCLSLEGLQLSDSIIRSLAQNAHLRQLNLSGCSDFAADALGHMLRSCSRIEQLNVSWCQFTNDHVKSVVNHVSAAVTHLNLSGYRDGLTLDDVKVLVTRCPDIHTLDLSDSAQLMADCLPALSGLPRLQHLSLSRCYHIHVAALSDLGKTFPALRYLEVFGLVNDGHLSSLRKESPGVSINGMPFSAVARPTPAGASHGMWDRKIRLRFKPSAF